MNAFLLSYFTKSILYINNFKNVKYINKNCIRQYNV